MLVLMNTVFYGVSLYFVDIFGITAGQNDLKKKVTRMIY